MKPAVVLVALLFGTLNVLAQEKKKGDSLVVEQSATPPSEAKKPRTFNVQTANTDEKSTNTLEANTVVTNVRNPANTRAGVVNFGNKSNDKKDKDKNGKSQSTSRHYLVISFDHPQDLTHPSIKVREIPREVFQELKSAHPWPKRPEENFQMKSSEWSEGASVLNAGNERPELASFELFNEPEGKHKPSIHGFLLKVTIDIPVAAPEFWKIEFSVAPMVKPEDANNVDDGDYIKCVKSTTFTADSVAKRMVTYMKEHRQQFAKATNSKH